MAIFLRLHGGEELHNGLIAIVPNVSRAPQIALWIRALDQLSMLPDLINQVLQVQLDGTVSVGPLAK